MRKQKTRFKQLYLAKCKENERLWVLHILDKNLIDDLTEYNQYWRDKAFEMKENCIETKGKIEGKIARTYIELNNALYFSDSKKSNYYNLIYDLLDILEMKNEEVGQKYIEINNEGRNNNER